MKGGNHSIYTNKNAKIKQVLLLELDVFNHDTEVHNDKKGRVNNSKTSFFFFTSINNNISNF